MIRRLITACAALAMISGAAALLVLNNEHLVVGTAEAKPAKAVSQPMLPPQYLYLIRSTLGALQDANTTGNYSVLRDLSAPSFQAKHSAADLAELFATARRRPIDLAPAAYVTPVMLETARPNPAQLSLSGYVPATGERVMFTLQFEAVGGHWRLAGVALSAAKEGARAPEAAKP